MKSWYNSETFRDFLYQTVPILTDQNVSIPSDQNILILFLSNMYNGNIKTFWFRQRCMKIWYNL